MFKPNSLTTSIDPTGFSLLRGSDLVARVDWAAVQQITSYKADLITYDTVAIAFVLPAMGHTITITEEVEGFESIKTNLPIIFPSIDPTWYERVLRPPFGTNETTLFKRTSNET